MTPFDREETARLRAAWESRETRDAEPPVDPETIWRAVRGELPLDEKRALVDRMAHDPDLALEWRLARELSAAADEIEAAEEGADKTAEEGETDERSAPVPFAPRRARWSTWAGLVAALFFAAIGLRVLGPADPEPPPIYRGTETTIEALTGDTLPRDEPVLRWQGLDEARYVVSVSTETLEPVFIARDLDEPSLRLPEDALVPLADGSVLLWRVEAHARDGGVVASETFRVRLVAAAKKDSTDSG